MIIVSKDHLSTLGEWLGRYDFGYAYYQIGGQAVYFY